MEQSELPETQACGRCQETKPLDQFHADRSKPNGRNTICKACVSARQKAQRATESPNARAARLERMRTYSKSIRHRVREQERQWRLEALELYGGRCVCCGETEPSFLTFDHVGEWGAQHRAEDPLAGSIVKWLRRHGFPRDKFRLLCWNCNCARGIRGGSCPHEDK